VRAELQLHFVKKLVNFCMKVLDRLLPEKEPYYPQTKMLEHTFQRFSNVYLLEVWCGRFDDVRHQNLRDLKDRNFLHFLSVARKTLLFISESDRYYRAWLGLFYVAAKEEYERALHDLSLTEFQQSHLEQWDINFPAVKQPYFEENKPEFLEMLLTANLSNLLRMKIASSGLPQSKELKPKNGKHKSSPR
jgi:hypothetical protein